MYILYWYIVLVVLVSGVKEIYMMSRQTEELTPAGKLGVAIGLMLRQATFIVFLVLVYPALEYLK